MSRFLADRITLWALRVGAFGAAGLVFLVVGFLCWAAFPALIEPGLGRFFGDGFWYPNEDQWGILPMVWGSLYATLGAVLLATPLALLNAVFCHFYAPPMVASGFRRMLGLLSGIPSVVYGFWGLVVLVPLIAKIAPPGPSLLAAILVLTLMILPTVALLVDQGLAQVPEEQIAAAHALGINSSGVIWRVAVPQAFPALVTGVVLGCARAIGETMAVLMVCGGVVNTPDSLFAPIRTLTANIALEMAYALGAHRAALFVSGLLLVAVVLVLVLSAMGLERRWTGQHG